MLTMNVRRATDSDQATLIGVITLAFSTDPMARWAFPDPATDVSVMPQVARAFGGNGLAHGAAHPRNISLYERHGFEAIGSIRSGTAPTMVPMLRRPR